MNSLSNTLNEWISANKSAYNWYFETYPFLKNIGLPIPFETLQEFYKTDYENRNLKIVPAVYNSYDLVFSYFLENYPRLNDPSRFKGKTDLEYIINAIPEGFSKTFSDFSSSAQNIFSSLSNTVIIVLILIAVILFIYKK